MAQKKTKSEEEVTELVNKYGSLIFRISYCILCNVQDAEDAVQETFLKYLTKSPEFNDEEHCKAWLIKVSANISKNMLMFRLRRETVNIDDIENIGIAQDDYEIFGLIMNLPAKYKVVMTLYYVEGYKCKEIAEIIDVNEDTVRKRLQKGRELLKKEFEKEQLL
ncbi:MAG: sigma-70 family RNA polymerase sigma factor [Clostridia bacterium]|nr:sigma-70 family RNA polymerase sigma factor [Clostridia bacterium]MBR3818722.1 sigma-70 family RNA polymerase sigma factor [Clostridia bacterium]